MSQEQILFLVDKFSIPLFILIIAVICIYPAIRLNRRMLRRFPERQPFAWGYFLALVTMVIGVMAPTIAIVNVNIADPTDISFPGYRELYADVARTLVVGPFLFCLGALVYRRNRWAWLVYVILNLNPVAWIINGIYLKNRWQEMKSEYRPIRKRLAAYWNKLQMSSRAIVAGAIFWAVFVIVFVALFDPYDGFYEEEFAHMLAVIIAPSMLAWFGIFLWRKVKEPGSEKT